jgi:hypothetical protein
MTKDEALKLALETLESSRVFVTSREVIKKPEGENWYDSRITAIKEALAQQEQRTWVGLTEEEIHESKPPLSNDAVVWELAVEWAEAKLREKNT